VLHYVEIAGFASLDELSRNLNISEMTVRRQLARLEEEGIVVRIRAGAIRTTRVQGADQAFSQKLSQNKEEKKAIAKYAATLVEYGQTIFIDTGSTCYYLAKRLPADKQLTVITHSLIIVNVLRDNPGVRVICPGGELDSALNIFAGPHTERLLDSFNADLAFVATDGLDLERGTQENSLVQTPIKATMNRNARTSLLVTDSSKLNCRSYFTGTPLKDLRHIVTTSRARPEHVDALKSAGIEVTIIAL
jgi:DeoR family transcriptional regulator, fructose operon transcriptional repressor